MLGFTRLSPPLHSPASIRALSRALSSSFALCVVAISGLFLIPTPAASLLLTTTGFVTEDPFVGLGPYHYVGALNGASGTYLGNGWVLTANHVGAGDFTLGGVTYSDIPGSAIRLETSPGVMADLVMFQIYPTPPNAPISIRQTSPVAYTSTILIGNGYAQGAPTSFDPYGPTLEPPLLNGWTWAGPKAVRWGINQVHDYPNLVILGTRTFRTQFDADFLEAQATTGDSGGATFIYETGSVPELAGIILAVSAEWQQPYGTCLLTNQTIIASLDVYRDQILQNIAVPEPTGALPAGLALVSILVRTRQAKWARPASSGPTARAW